VIVKINILYLEYHPGDARIAESILAKAGVHCNVLAVSDISEYQQAVINVPPDIVISDDGAPLWNAMDALTILKQTGLNIPFIVITDPSTGNIYSVIKVMKQGADDYLLKYHFNTLPDVIKAAIGKRDGKNKDFDVRLNTMEAASISEDMLHSEAMQMSGPCEEIYGYRTEELPADPDLQEKINHPDDRQLLQKFTLKLRKGEPITGKYRIRKDNDIRRIENKIKLTPGGKGESALIDSDSHEAKIERDKLILSEQRYRQIVETAQEGIWIIDENLLTIFVNKKLCDMLGYAAEEILGKHNYDFKDPAEREKALERLKNRDLHTTETHESTFITRSGKTLHCWVITNGLFDTDGVFQGTLAMLTDITRRKADEDALRRSEANLSAIIENTTDLVYSIDANFQFITYNQLFKNTMKQVYGFDIEQGASIYNLVKAFNEEMAAKWKKIYMQALKGETLQFVNEYPFGDDKIYLSYSVNPIWETGRVIGLSCFSRDITRQKLDEAAIKKSAASLAAIIENTDTNIYSLDSNLRYITFNKLCKDSIWQAYRKVINPGDNVMDFLKESDPEAAADWEAIYSRALTGQSIQFTKEFNFGEVAVFLNFSINPIWENEAVIGLSCAARDITRQVSDEMAVRKSEASLRTIFNNTDMACMLIDNGGNFVSFNNLAKQFSEEQGRKIGEGCAILDWVDDDRRGIVTNILDEAKNGKVINYQVSRNIKGVIRWFEMTWAGIKDLKRQDFGYIFTIREVTRQKKLEVEREKITTDIIQRNKALEQFTYIISHNLRAPVANIIGLSSLMDGIAVESAEICEIVGSISRSANKLDEVISDLNQILQVNEDVNENVELIVLPRLINDIKFSIRHLMEKERVNISLDFNAASEMLSVKSFIHSIFYNLILNSIKYRNPGMPPLINIVTSICNGKIIICYKDNGRGIDTSRYADELFGLYKRFDTSVEGKGMGLFMVKMQAESLGGTISLQSKPGKGTEFVLEFPQMHLQKG